MDKVYVLVGDFCYSGDPVCAVYGVFRKEEDAKKALKERRDANASNFPCIEQDVYRDDEYCYDAFSSYTFRYRIYIDTVDVE